MDRIKQCLEIVNSQQNLTTAEVVKLIVEPLLQTIARQDDRIQAQDDRIQAQDDRIQALVSPSQEQLP
jgi:hypothetical protein